MTKVNCPTCHGDGIVMDCSCVKRHEEMICDNPNCTKGKVKRVVQQHDGTTLTVLEDCPVCDGLNRIIKEIEETWEQPTTCPSCQGEGVISCAALEKKNLQVLCDTCHGVGYQFDLKKIALLGVFAGWVLLMPMVAFGVIMFVALVFSVKTVLTQKNLETTQVVKRKRCKETEVDIRHGL